MTRTRLKQTGVVLLGLVVTAAMLLLGLWQLDVYGRSGTRAADARAAAPAVALATVARPGEAVQDGYGRQVEATGRWDRSLQVLVTDPGTPGQYRVLTGLRLDTGGVLPVVRGLVVDPVGTGPTPPGGTARVTGVLLGSEPDPGGATSGGDATGGADGRLSAVELPVLAQRWANPLVNGFVTLDAASASRQGLTAARAVLPEGQGRSRNAAYALQWWIFAAFALGLAIRMARDLGRRDDYEYAQQNTSDRPDDPAVEPDDVPEPGLSHRA